MNVRICLALAMLSAVGVLAGCGALGAANGPEPEGAPGAAGAAAAPESVPAWARSGSEPAPERPLLKRKVLQEEVISDWASKAKGGAPTAKTLNPEVTAACEGGVLKLVYAPRSNNAAVQLNSDGQEDVTGFDLLRLDITNTGKERVAATLTFGDPAAKFDLPLDPGLNAVALPLCHRPERALGKNVHMAKLGLIKLSVARQATAATLQIGNIAVQKLFTDASKIKFFDFGPGACFPGAIPVRPGEDLVDAEAPYQAKGDDRAANGHDGFDLFGDGVDSSANAWTFNPYMDVGECEAQAVAYGTNWQGVRNRSYRILVGDQPAVDVKITKDNFFTFDGQYYGANIFYDPNKSLFDQYHRKYFAPVTFPLTVEKDKAPAITFENCGAYALWIYPKAMAEEGRAFVECCYAEQAYDLWLKTARMRAHARNPNAAPEIAGDKAKPWKLFTRYYQDRVYPNYEPSADEILPTDANPAPGLKITCAPGESEPVTFTIRPATDLPAVSVTISDLVRGASKINGAAIPIYIVKCVPQQVSGLWYEAVPTMLYPAFPQPLKAGWNTQYWATVTVPAGTPAGTYTGEIQITDPAAKTSIRLGLQLEVRSFALPKTTTECGMWNNSAFDSHMLNSFPDNADLTAKILKAECQNMADHGLNGYDFGGITVKDYDKATCTVKVDFTRYQQLLDACNAAGMTGRHMMQVQNFAQYGLMKRGFPEFSDDFNKAYIHGLTQLRDWIKTSATPAVVQITDEPRETGLNPWNRNLADTVKYLRLARKVDALKTMVTVMADKGAFGRPYAPIVGLVDVLSSHSWPKSDDIIFLATETGMADYWAYNNGFNRFAHGFYLWKIKGLGHWQWVYSWEVCDAHIPVFFPKDSSAVYAFPGGFLDTIKYEDIREGIDDHRYLELLLTTLKTADKANPAKAPAEAFLKTLNKFLPQYPHDTGLETGAEAGGVYSESKQNLYFGAWREQVAEYITALQANRAPAKVDAAWAMFPQSAKEEDRSVECKLIDKAAAPVIDGKADDAAWKDAKEIGDFVDLAQGRNATVQTKVKTVCDGEKVYFLFTCTEAKYGELKGYAINRDEDTWEDDSVEVFLDTALDRKTYKHLSVNCLGTVQDEDTRDILWNAETSAAVQKTKGAWTVELAVSLKDLGGKTPVDGATWGINLCRNRQPAPQETSSWAFVGHSFHNPAKFGTLQFKK